MFNSPMTSHISTTGPTLAFTVLTLD